MLSGPDELEQILRCQWQLFLWSSLHLIPFEERCHIFENNNIPVSKVQGTNMGPIWGRQDPGGPHVGSMNLAIWEGYTNDPFVIDQTPLLWHHSKSQFAGTLKVLTFKPHYNLMNYHFYFFYKVFKPNSGHAKLCKHETWKKIQWKDNIVTNDLYIRNIYLYACHVNNTGML